MEQKQRREAEKGREEILTRRGRREGRQTGRQRMERRKRMKELKGRKGNERKY